MIITKAPRLSAAELAEMETIVAEFNCRIQPIHGAHRDIYAIIGDERSETMVNRILGLDYVDRVDRMESIYKLMDIRSNLALHRVTIAGIQFGAEPIIMAGQCTIDPKHPELFYATAEGVKQAGAHVLRGGVWKPRTSPHAFQGDAKSLDILLEARRRTGLPVVTEVMEEEHLEAAVEAGVDILQIGARNALNYSLLRKIGRLTAAKGTPVLLKRSLHMGAIDEFIAAAEYIVAGGNPNVLLCPRGTQPTVDGYRNNPDESITPLLKQKTWAPVVVDPSHSVGRATYVPAAALAAIAYGADGVIVETHVEPRAGIGDDPLQSITPDALKKLVTAIKTVWPLRFRVG
ncbi:MAG: 3-deoxy-D-arabino-heptulosonate 7-phosphate synthase [Verrucomicrobiota bacterium]|nr:3-deoxy-D-arabino-heptulosonate 7-phosphate synthase [Verrucomicrobiota bacterium]